MMTGPVWLVVAWATRPALAFMGSFSATNGCGVAVRSSRRSARQQTGTTYRSCRRWMGVAPSSSERATDIGKYVSRLDTLQTLLSKYGAPGSVGCKQPKDLISVMPMQNETPELISLLSGNHELTRLHPYLYPIAKSQSSGHYICAYRTPTPTDGETKAPWPIVETKTDGPGMRLLALNSEHLMRRMVCECDVGSEGSDMEATLDESRNEIVHLYNAGLGQGLLADDALDIPYQPGSVQKLGYGVDKYVLLRVGPFPDLYEKLSLQHLARGDEQSALIAAESANGKLPGFGSTFAFYARLLQKLPQPRDDESRDAARMCLRLPLSTMGFTWDEIKEVAVLGQVAERSDSLDVVLDKVKALYTKIKQAEAEKDESSQGKSLEQIAIDEANHLLDLAVLEMRSWDSLRPELTDRFRAAACHEMAQFIDSSNVLQ